MPSPRPPGLGVEKILISPHEVPEDHVLHFFVLARCSSEPGVGFLASRLRFLLFLDGSSPGLPLVAFCAPLSFPARCSTVPGEVSHFVTIVTLHLGGISTPFSLRTMVPLPWREGRFLILLVSWRRFVVRQCESSLRP